MNDLNTNISCNGLKPHGLHYIRRSMAERMISELSNMPAEIRKHLGCCFSKKTMEKYIYAKPSKEQMEAALARTSKEWTEAALARTSREWTEATFASMLDLEEPAK